MIGKFHDRVWPASRLARASPGVFGVLGWLMMKFDVPRAPLALALVLAWLLVACAAA
jgi:hypothetical protein